MTQHPEPTLEELIEFCILKAARSHDVGRDYAGVNDYAAQSHFRVEAIYSAIATRLRDLNKKAERSDFYALTLPDGSLKIAPVQGYPQGIPWSLHLKAYEVYCKKYSGQVAMIDLVGRGCRGGFGTDELDDFIPGWRNEVEELALLRAEVTRLRAVKNAPPRELLWLVLRTLESQKQICPTGTNFDDDVALAVGQLRLFVNDHADSILREQEK